MADDYEGAPVCQTCGIQYRHTSLPTECMICTDDRQFVPRSGQSWTTLSKMKLKYVNAFKKHENNLYEITTFPKFGIGQRAFLIQTPEGNILWDCISFLDEATIDIIQSLGGLKAIAISHPHYYTTHAQWSRVFGDIPVYIHEWDKRWVVWDHSNVKFWKGQILELCMGMTLVHLGGHFAGAQILHWSDGAQGKGALLTGDILQVGMDNSSVSVMRSYPNFIPLSAGHVERIRNRVEKLEFDRLYGAFPGREIQTDVKFHVAFSLQRYLQWLQMDDETA